MQDHTNQKLQYKRLGLAVLSLTVKCLRYFTPNYKLKSANSFSSSQELPLEDFVVTRKAWVRLQRRGCSSTCFSFSIILSELRSNPMSLLISLGLFGSVQFCKGFTLISSVFRLNSCSLSCPESLGKKAKRKDFLYSFRLFSHLGFQRYCLLNSIMTGTCANLVSLSQPSNAVNWEFLVIPSFLFQTGNYSWGFVSDQ